MHRILVAGSTGNSILYSGVKCFWVLGMDLSSCQLLVPRVSRLLLCCCKTCDFLIWANFTDRRFEHRIFGTAIAISSFLNLLVPGATSLSPTLVIMVRICQGFVEVSDMWMFTVTLQPTWIGFRLVSWIFWYINICTKIAYCCLCLNEDVTIWFIFLSSNTHTF
jgi:hypothetical protein